MTDDSEHRLSAPSDDHAVVVLPEPTRPADQPPLEAPPTAATPPRRHRRWGLWLGVAAAFALVAGMTAFAVNQRSSAQSWQSKAGDVTTQLDASKAAQARTAADLTTAQSQLATAQAELARAQADVARVTSTRDALIASVKSGAPTIDAALACWDEDLAMEGALNAWLQDQLTDAQFNAAIAAHNVGHDTGSCDTAFDDLQALREAIDQVGTS